MEKPNENKLETLEDDNMEILENNLTQRMIEKLARMSIMVIRNPEISAIISLELDKCYEKMLTIYTKKQTKKDVEDLDTNNQTKKDVNIADTNNQFKKDVEDTNNQTKKDLLPTLLHTNIQQLVIEAEELYDKLPSLTEHITTIKNLSKTTEVNEQKRRMISLEIRLGFEEMLNALILHFSCPAKEGMPLADRVLFLKPHMQPQVRLNAFFDIKEYASLGVHKYIHGSNAISYRVLEKMVVALRSVMEETKTCLRTYQLSTQVALSQRSTRMEHGELYNKSTSNLSIVSGPGKYKSIMCRNWIKYRECPHANKCLFAHGLNELQNEYEDQH